MSRFASIFKPLRPWKKSRQPNWVPSILDLLPPELILCINDFLGLPDTLCLGRCSHHLHEALRRPRLPAGDTLLKETMLARVAPDCASCAKQQFTKDILHPSAFDSGLFSSKKPKIPKRSQWCPEIDAYRRDYKSKPIPLLCVGGHLDFVYSFAHCHLMAAMKNHYHRRRFGPTAKSLAFRKVRTLEMDPLKTTLLSVDARVCVPGRGTDDAALVLQIQNWTLFDSEVEDDVIVDVLRRMEVCNHTSVGDAPEGGDTTTTTEPSHGIDHISEHLSCPDCDSEYQFSLRDCGVHGRAFLITTWMDLGAGLDINDLKWKKMAAGFPDGQAPKPSSEVSRMFQEASRLQKRESDPTDLNQAILIGSRYRRLLRSLYRFLYKSVPVTRYYIRKHAK